MGPTSWVALLVLLGLVGGVPSARARARDAPICATLGARLEEDRLADDAVQAYVEGVGQRLVRALGPRPGRYRFVVLLRPEVNAYATCGGRVYVTTGMLHFVEDEAELAGVLAHEIVHNDERHLLRSERKARQLEDLVERGGLASLPVALFGGLGLLKFSREYEEDADEDGVKLMIAAGYRGQAFVRVLERMQAAAGREPNLFEHLVMRHPTFPHRIRKVKTDILKMKLIGRFGHAPDDGAFRSMKGRLASP